MKSKPKTPDTVMAYLVKRTLAEFDPDDESRRRRIEELETEYRRRSN